MQRGAVVQVRPDDLNSDRQSVVDADSELVGILSLDDILKTLAAELGDIGRVLRDQSPATLGEIAGFPMEHVRCTELSLDAWRMPEDEAAHLRSAASRVLERPVIEIARTLGVPVGTAKWRLHAARQALEHALEVEA